MAPRDDDAPLGLDGSAPRGRRGDDSPARGEREPQDTDATAHLPRGAFGGDSVGGPNAGGLSATAHQARGALSPEASYQRRGGSSGRRTPAAATPAPGRPVSKPEMFRLLAQRFELLGELGEGGMGVVLRAREPGNPRELAVKVVLGERLGPNGLERFRREGEITASLRHPSILKVHAAGEIDGLPYIAYELVEGARDFERGCEHLDMRERVRILRDVALGLGHAHERGVVHRDVKPDNVLIDERGNPKVADFGLARMHGQERLTQTGTMVGTPYYMSPEVFSGAHDLVGPQADVWALGVMLFQVLTGGLFPFEGESLRALEVKIMMHPAPDPLVYAPDAPQDLGHVCLQALRKHPKDRYPDASAMARDLDAWLEGRAISASQHSGLSAAWYYHRRKLPALVSLGVAALTLIGASIFALRDHDAPAPDTSAPTITFDGAPTITWRRELTLRGTVTDESPWVDLRVGREDLRALPGKPFEVTLRLRPGRNEIALRAVDSADNEHESTLVVTREEVPSWFAKLEQRPPYPLAKGLAFGKTAGEYVYERDGTTFLWVPPGSFDMGLPEGTPFNDPTEQPAHRVTLTKGFFLGKLEVGRTQYLRFCDEVEHRRPPPPPFKDPRLYEHPIAHVTWDDAVAYCRWARLRLPTEAEWEFAARGPESLLFPWGNELGAARHANSSLPDPYEFTAPRGSYPLIQSPFGHLDMSGNVWEWVSDHYAPGYPKEAQIDPKGPKSGVHRIHRGGGWNSQPSSLRTTIRSNTNPYYTNTVTGFRVALSPD